MPPKKQAASKTTSKPKVAKTPPKNKEEETKKRVGKYPKWVTVTPENANMDRFREMYGGSLPSFNPNKTKHKYPHCSDEQGWRVLYAEALTYRNKSRYCNLKGYAPPKFPKKSQYEYVLVHGTKKMIQDRSQRNIDRKRHGLEKGDVEVVHHTTPDNLEKGYTVRLSFCEHQAVHGKKCNNKK